jgi:metal-responsive CopG/Arc/MetJ family transcriptional regulator
MAAINEAKEKDVSVGFGINFPKSLIERIDRAKQPYLSRTKFMQKVMTEYLDHIEEEEKKGALGSRTTNHESQGSAQVATVEPTKQHLTRGMSTRRFRGS